MAFDLALADRVRPLLRRLSGFEEKALFGGIGFLLHGNMCIGVWKEFLILRVGTDVADTLLSEPHFRPFDITGRAMAGWVMAEPEAVASRDGLERCVSLAVDFVLTLPPKQVSGPARPRRSRTAKPPARKRPRRTPD